MRSLWGGVSYWATSCLPVTSTWSQTNLEDFCLILWVVGEVWGVHKLDKQDLGKQEAAVAWGGDPRRTLSLS